MVSLVSSTNTRHRLSPGWPESFGLDSVRRIPKSTSILATASTSGVGPQIPGPALWRVDLSDD